MYLVFCFHRLLTVSHTPPGLTRDDDALHDERIELWNRFNRAWLTTLQRQFDLTDQVLRHQQQPPPSLMSAQTLEQLSRELVRLCDNVERHGLVDYQMGVAEEEIMDREPPPYPTPEQQPFCPFSF